MPSENPQPAFVLVRPQMGENIGAAARATIDREDLTWRGNARRVVERVEALRK